MPRGNPVRFRGGPAAVIGDESRVWPLGCLSREGVASRVSQEPEDLPD